MPEGITDSNQDMVAEFRQQLDHDNIELIAQAVHQISHDVHELVRIVRDEAADIRALRAAWDEHGAVVRGYQAGGLLGARAARKAVGNGRVQ